MNGLSTQAGMVTTSDPAAGADVDATALIAAMAVAPDAARQTLINDTIVALKTAGIWAKLDYLRVVGHDSQASLLWWNDPTRSASLIGSPAFTTDMGHTCNGSSTAINTNWIPSADSVNSSRNDIVIGGHTNQNRLYFGAWDSVNPRNASMMIFKGLDGSLKGDINYNTLSPGTSLSGGFNTDPRLRLIQRASSSTIVGFVDGIQQNSAGRASTATVIAFPYYESAYNRNDDFVEGQPSRPTMGLVAQALTVSEHSDLYDIMVDGYLTALGAHF